MKTNFNNSNQSYIKEKYLKNSPKSLSLEQNEYINKQMKYSVCKIECDNNKNGTGFICYIPFPDKLNLLPVLITNNHILDYSELVPGKFITISFNDNKSVYKIDMSKNRKFYTEKGNIDTTIIEIKKSDGLNYKHFLEIDEDIFEEKINEKLKEKTIYFLHYPYGNNVNYSLGTIKNILNDGLTIEHFCNSDKGSSGGPLLRLFNFKVFGVHKEGKATGDYNLGTLINIPIQNFYQEYALINVKKDDISMQNTFNFNNIYKTSPAKLSFNEKHKNNNLKNNFILNKADGQNFYNILDLETIIRKARENSLLSLYDKAFENYTLGILIIKYRVREIHLTNKELEEKWKYLEKIVKEELDNIIEIMKILKSFNKVYK